MDARVTELDQQLFSKSYALKTRMRRIAQAFGSMHDRSGLCIGQVPTAFRARLLALGGDWTFTTERAELPYKDGAFDRVLLLDHLEWVEDDYSFMAEVHRVLKTAGLLYVDTEHRKRWTVWRPIRRLFGADDRSTQRLRPGYTEPGLFDILKDGFDLQETRTYSRFFTEGAETLLRLAIGAFAGPADVNAEYGEEDDDPDATERLQRRLYLIQAIFYPFCILSAKLDWLLLFTRGYRLRALARRRLWKPRRTPVLRDGRTLADATLNTRIGTAAPF